MSDYKQMAIDRLTAAGFEKETAGIDFDLIVEAYAETVQTKNKGLLLSGGVGCGKTMALKAIFPNACFYDLTDSTELDLLTPYEGYDDHLERSMVKWWAITARRSIILDDIGNEPIKNDYGTRVDVLANFIMKWNTENYKVCREKVRLFGTTNLTIEQLIERYGNRITDRLFEMVSFVQMSGKSHRQYGKVFKNV